MTAPRAGDVLLVDRAASVQFLTPIVVRIIHVHDWTTYGGWVWLRVYELDAAGAAVAERDIFVKLDGLLVIGRGSEVQPDAGGSPDRRAAHACGRFRSERPARTSAPTSRRAR
ncbi:hypothetical protein [Actinoplanes awajinensis]|uniref:hypothetical protein n=1 Tax=Actinoplanes awajinensis TaxID=135946 RepID=UPI000833F93C|nr:hypothetical protein [Actinoplanes awajinensis]